jgi:hypothetical protein
MPATAVALLQALGGELITYTTPGHSPKDVWALIERVPLSVESSGRATFRVYSLYLANDETDGITSVKERFDTVSFKERLSDTAETTFLVQQVLEQDSGMPGCDNGIFKLEVKR